MFRKKSGGCDHKKSSGFWKVKSGGIAERRKQSGEESWAWRVGAFMAHLFLVTLSLHFITLRPQMEILFKLDIEGRTGWNIDKCYRCKREARLHDCCSCAIYVLSLTFSWSNSQHDLQV